MVAYGSDSDRKSLAEHTALVVGASKNIGRGIALKLAHEGANVAVVGKTDSASLAAVRDEIRGLGRESEAFQVDIGFQDQATELVHSVKDKLGGVDIFVNTVGIRPLTPFTEISEDELMRVLRSNLFGSFFLAQLLIPHMVEAGFGRILWFSGMGSFVGVGKLAHSSAAKMALMGLTRSLAREYASSGITVNLRVPGVIDTERPYKMFFRGQEDLAAGEPGSVVIDLPPVGRMGRIEEVADLCAHLCAHGGFMTGQTFHVNGGAYFG